MVLARAGLLGCASVLLVCASVLLVPATVGAQELPDLDGEVTDQAGVLGADVESLTASLRDIREREGVHLLALYTGSTGERTVTSYAEEVAAANSLGGDDALLVVALDDRTYALWVSDALTGVTDADIDRLLVEEVEPRLADGDYAGAATAAAEALAAAAGTPGGEEQPGRGLGFVPVLLIVLGVGLVGSVLVGRVRERQGRRRAAEERDRRLGELARQANALLLASDEAVRDATQELAFAEAQFREMDVAPFREALGRAREELHAAFAVRQRLDDGVPETAEERERLLREVVSHTERVDRLLVTEHARLDELREVERNAPALLAALPDEIDAVERRAGEAEGLLGHLHEVAARNAASVEGNLVEARKRLAAARETVSSGTQILEQAEPGGAGVAVRDAQDALAQAGELVGAVERLAAAAGEAERHLDAELRAAAGDVDAAAEVLASGRVQGLDAPMAEARSLLEQARSEASSRQPDVLESYRLATRANAAADEVLAAVRERQEQSARELASATGALRTAEAAYTRAADYVATRRHGIGREARTRLGEAERHLERARALLPAAPDGSAAAREGQAAREAATEARSAERLAGEAYRLAQRDFDDYDRYQGPFGRGPYGGGWRRGATVIIGGFPIPIGGSPRGGGGWGGSTWGSAGHGRSRGGGFAGGRARGGGFGGGRVGGGGFGGGRSRGGRF